MQRNALLRLGILALTLSLFACGSRSDEENGSLSVALEPIDHPLIVSGIDGSQVVVNPNPIGLFYEVRGVGFKSNETLTFHSVSENEEVKNDLQTDQKGSFIMFYCPAVIGKTFGTSSLSFTRENETMKLDVPWKNVH